MNNQNVLKLFPVLISAVYAGNVFANGFGLPDQDAFATARGEAFVATADNPSAVFYNPSGIAQLDGDNFRGGVYGIYLDPTYNPPGGGDTYHSSDHFAEIPQFFYVHSLEKAPLSFGLGIYAPFGGNMDWPQDTGFRSVAISGSLEDITVNPVIAWKISPALSIGGGVMANYANLKTSQGLLGSQAPFVNFFNFHGDGWSVGWNIGALWKPSDKISIGATFRSSARVTLNGQTHFEQQPLIPDSHRSANMGFDFPRTVVAGISYRPTPKWNLEFDGNYTDWNSFDTFHLQQKNPPPQLNPDIPVHFGWQGSWMYEFGVTRYFDNGWHVSGGYVFNENSVPDQYYTPLAADLDRHFFSLGAGYNGKRFDFDVAYQFGYGPKYSVNGSAPSSTPGQFASQSADGKYGFNSSAVILTIGAHF